MTASVFVLLLGCVSAIAQSSSFTYQGSLKEANAPASGVYDFTFKLFSVEAGGTQVGSDIVSEDVQVTNGTFTVNLSFGSTPFFEGTGRFLDISVRPGASTGAFTPLAPRRQITSSPYSIKSYSAEIAREATTATNALQLGTIPANEYLTTTASNGLFILNSTGVQPSSNFSIAGTGIVMGNVGIGRVNPLFKLHVVGENVRVESDATNVLPRFSLNFIGGGVDRKKWQNYANGNGLNFSALSDAEDTENFWLKVNRGPGTNIPSVAFPNGNVGIGTESPITKLHVVGEGVRVEGNATSVAPRFSLNFTGGDVNKKKWQNYASTNGLNFSAVNDLENQENFWLQVNRGAGTAISSVVLPHGKRSASAQVRR